VQSWGALDHGLASTTHSIIRGQGLFHATSSMQAGAGKGRREGQGGAGGRGLKAGGAGTGAGVSQRVSRSHVCMTRSREPVEDF
jgi:hypothetical protein